MYKKIISILTAAVVCFLSAFVCSAQTKTIKHTVPVPPKIVFLGDSIAAGYGLDGYSRENLYACNSYANILGERYKQVLSDKTDSKMINDAISGITSYQLLEHLTNGDFDSELKDSSAIVVSIGGNDILYTLRKLSEMDLGIDKNTKFSEIDFKKVSSALGKVFRNLSEMSDNADVAINEFNENLPKIVNAIKKRSHGQIIIQTLYNPLESFTLVKPIQILANEKIGILNDKIRENANTDDNENYIVSDVAAKFQGRAEELTNIEDFDIHPNSEGHKLIAECVDETIRTKSYFYTETIEVPDEVDKSDSNVLILIVCGSAFLLIVAACGIIIRKRRKKGGERT